MTFPQASEYDFGTGDFTVDFWLYPTASGENNVAVISLGNGANGGGPYAGWAVILQSGVLHFYRYDGTETNISLSLTPTVNVWQHVAIVRLSGTLTAYLNGTSTYSGADTISYNHVNADPLNIGQFQAGGASTLVRRLYRRIEGQQHCPLDADFTPPTSAYVGTTLSGPVAVGNAGLDSASTDRFVAEWGDGSGGSLTTKTTFTNNYSQSLSAVVSVRL